LPNGDTEAIAVMEMISCNLNLVLLLENCPALIKAASFCGVAQRSRKRYSGKQEQLQN